MARRRPANRGQRCKRWQRVRGRLRCKAYTYPRRRLQMGFRRGHVPANRGARCVRRKRVFSPWYNRNVWRCAKYSSGRYRRPSRAAKRRRVLITPAPKDPKGTFIVPLRFFLRPSTEERREPRVEGYVPMSLPSMERMVAGRTPV